MDKDLACLTIKSGVKENIEEINLILSYPEDIDCEVTMSIEDSNFTSSITVIDSVDGDKISKILIKQEKEYNMEGILAIHVIATYLKRMKNESKLYKIKNIRVNHEGDEIIAEIDHIDRDKREDTVVYKTNLGDD